MSANWEDCLAAGSSHPDMEIMLRFLIHDSTAGGCRWQGEGSEWVATLAEPVTEVSSLIPATAKNVLHRLGARQCLPAHWV